MARAWHRALGTHQASEGGKGTFLAEGYKPNFAESLVPLGLEVFAPWSLVNFVNLGYIQGLRANLGKQTELGKTAEGQEEAW